MLKQHWRLVSMIARISDNIIFVLAFIVAYKMRDLLFSFLGGVGIELAYDAGPLGSLQDYSIVVALSILFYNGILSGQGAYRSMRMASGWHLLRLMLWSSMLAFLGIAAVLFVLKTDISRSFVGIYCALCGISLFWERLIVLRILRYFRVNGRNYRNILIAGTGAQARKLYQQIVQMPEVGVRIAGFVELDSEREAAGWKIPARFRFASGQLAVKEQSESPASAVFDLPARVIASASNFEEVLKQRSIDEVLFTDIISYYDKVQELAELAVEEGVTTTFAADLFSAGIINSDVTYFGDIPLLHYEPIPSQLWSLIAKRTMDIVISSVGLMLSLPLLCLLAVLIKLDSSGPIFFKQKRVGLNGRTFILYKFRSMVPDADKEQYKLVSSNEMKGPVFKIKDDPRVTRLGKFIRRYSLDELPQLLNVMMGDMSLVGPRPPVPEEVACYKRKQRRRLSMRPGITCTWQVTGRNEIDDFDRWAQLDLEYIDNWSLIKDFKILLSTIPAVFGAKGAS